MAQSERFYYWRAIHEQMMKLTDEDAGRYIKAIGRWAFDGQDTGFDDALLDFAWPPIRDSVSESVSIGIKNSENGRRGGRPKSGGKSGAKSGGFSGGKSGGKSGGLTGAKSGAESAAESALKSGAESVGKGSEEKKESSSNFPSSSVAPAASGGAGAPSEKTLGPDGRWYIGHQCVGPFDEDAEGGGLDAEHDPA